MSDLATELSRFTNAAADLAKAKVNQKDALTALGQTVDDDWSTYPEKLSAVSGATVQDSKTVEPNPAGMEILPDDGYGAMLKVILAAEPNFQPWNIAAGIEIWGKTGTARPYVKPGGTDWPDVPATEEEMDEAVTEDDADAPVEDKFVLMDNEGNVTTGYLYTEPDSGLMVYGGAVLPDVDDVWTDEVKETHPYAAIAPGTMGIPTLYLSSEKFVYSQELKEQLGQDLCVAPEGATIREYAWSWGWADQLPAEWTQPIDRVSSGTSPYLSVKWTSHDILHEDGSVYLAASTPTEYDGFQITWYDPLTTEFKAIGWRRVSKHTTGEDAGKITRDNFTRTESGGWNYLKNIRSCTREALYYKGVEVWPRRFAITQDALAGSYSSADVGSVSFDVGNFPYTLRAQIYNSGGSVQSGCTVSVDLAPWVKFFEIGSVFRVTAKMPTSWNLPSFLDFRGYGLTFTTALLQDNAYVWTDADGVVAGVAEGVDAYFSNATTEQDEDGVTLKVDVHITGNVTGGGFGDWMNINWGLRLLSNDGGRAYATVTFPQDCLLVERIK